MQLTRLMPSEPNRSDLLDRQALACGRLWTRYGVVAVAASELGVREVELPRWDGQEAVTAETTAAQRAEVISGASGEGGDARPHLEGALAQLGEYFGAARRSFTAALDPVGTPFLRRVWDAVARVPFGETRSYGEIAAEIGATGASRAVGRANALNPVAPFVPCHRIVGSDGQLTGYGPGLPFKARLLRMEDALPADPDDYDAWTARVAARIPGGEFYLGSRRTRTYCRPGCERSRAASQLPARLLRSAAEAAAAGFAPCLVCAP